MNALNCTVKIFLIIATIKKDTHSLNFVIVRVQYKQIKDWMCFKLSTDWLQNLHYFATKNLNKKKKIYYCMMMNIFRN